MLSYRHLREKIEHRLILRGQLMLLLICSLVCLCSSTSVQASIMLPENGVFTANSEQLLADYEQSQQAAASTGTSTSGESSSEDMPPTSPEEDLAQQLAAMLAAQSEGSTSGTSSSSGSTGGAASGATLLASHISTVPTPSPTGRYAEEQSLFLPDAPGNKLLRPPQA